MTVTGIGGFFFRAHDPEALATWYRDHLGVGTGEYGRWRQEAGDSVFAPFQNDTGYFPKDKQWMLNLRVVGLDALIAKLRAAGIEVIVDPAWNAPGFGHFARIHDPEGNPIELWEPAAPAG